MKIPSLAEAQALLDEAQERNPGPWAAHSHLVAEAARRIAEKVPGLDPQAASILGLLHDIGRREGPSHIRHLLDGYQYLNGLAYPDAARICLTHSFPNRQVGGYSGEVDISPEEMAFLTNIVETVEYTPYDRLIQLCDCVSLPTGWCLMEKRMVDVALRYGTNEFTVRKWRAFFEVRAEFEAIIGQSLYLLLPGVVENTFAV